MRCSSAPRRFCKWLLVMTMGVAGFPLSAGAAVNFNLEVRPLLNAHCVKCHGGVKQAGGLNLLFRESAFKGGKSGTAGIVPGKPEASEVIARLTTSNEDDRMPKKADPLRAEQIELLKRWVAEGAAWEDHWAYVPPKASGRSIDQLVASKLGQLNLTWSPEADRWTLARRTALDLTGLPPTPEQVEAFVKDSAPNAYERWVDRLLASPSYGERWAVPWLDIARYADSKGYEKDAFRDMWRYRDWVIDAYNSDMPYDEFLTEQIAGDLLPTPTEEQIIATAFHRNTQANDEGGTDDEEFRTYAVIDRLNSTFDALQGTTIGCVQCHGHPYDPFVNREYYQLLAFFDNTADADRDDDAPTQKFYAKADVTAAHMLKERIAARQRQLNGELKTSVRQAAFNAWLKERQPPKDLVPLRDVHVTSSQGQYRVEPDGRVRLEGGAPTQTTITIDASVEPGKVAALILALLPDDALPHRGPGASESGNFILTHLSAVQFSSNNVSETPLRFASARATIEQPSWPIAEALKRGRDEHVESEGGWAIQGGIGQPQSATFVLAKVLDLPVGGRLRVTLECENERQAKHVLGSFKLATRPEDVTEKFEALPKEIRTLLQRDPASWTPEERDKLERTCFLENDPELTAIYQSLDRDTKSLASLPVCNLPIMHELGGKEARITRVFHRGNWMDKDEPVFAGTPIILNPWHEDYPRNRLGFAKWLTNGQNPLTARVQVNRIWEQLFGVGLVETLEDFGSQGDKPVQQDLLDELAARFQSEMKWSQKALLREIVLSRVYRQSSKASAALLERDPANRLLARGPRFRLPGEQLRDQALSIGGLLSEKMFGPPVMPYQPPGIWLTPYEGRDWLTATNAEGHRRGVYTFIRRSATYPSFITFDAPSREFCTVRRIRSNTPLQSLDLLNSPVFFEAANGLARRMKSEGGAQLEGQLSRGLLVATLRPPTAERVAILKTLYEKVDGNLVLVANAILNLDEVLNKN